MKMSELALKDQLLSVERSSDMFAEMVKYNTHFTGEKMQFACMIAYYIAKTNKTDDSLEIFRKCIYKSFKHDFEMEYVDDRYLIDTEVARIDAQKYAEEIINEYLEEA